VKEKKIEDQVFELALPVTQEKGLELVGVEYVKEGASWILRVYIDKDGGVDHEDCQAVSHLLSDILDAKDPISQAYFLEVSSPGIERILQREKDLEKYRNALVNVHTYSPVENKKILQGQLGPVTDKMLALDLDTAEVLRFRVKK